MFERAAVATTAGLLLGGALGFGLGALLDATLFGDRSLSLTAGALVGAAIGGFLGSLAAR